MEQRRLLQTRQIPVYDEKRQTMRLIPFDELDVAQAELAIDEKTGKLRSPEQQKASASIRRPHKDAPPQTMHLIVERSVGARVQLAAQAAHMNVSEYLTEHLPMPIVPPAKKKA